MLRSLFAVIAASTAFLGATAAHAGTHWAVGINVPVAEVVVSNGGYYAQEPAPVYYAPVPRYVESYYAAPRVYAPPRVVYSEPQAIYQVPYRGWVGERDDRWERRREFEHARWEHERHERWERMHDDGDSHRWHHD